MKKVYIVTGGAGHLGSTLLRKLEKSGREVRALLLPQEQPPEFARGRGGRIVFVRGDVRDADSLRPLFSGAEGAEEQEFLVFHPAGIVDISGEITPAMTAVNVGGTKNVIALCREQAHCRLVYVSSVHAIPEKGHRQVLEEVRRFSPDQVVGGYAKTKAEATQAVLDAAADGLDAVVVHPSGILGPYDSSRNHLVQMVSDYLRESCRPA